MDQWCHSRLVPIFFLETFEHTFNSTFLFQTVWFPCLHMHIHTAACQFLCVPAYCEEQKQMEIYKVQGWHSLMFSAFPCSSGVPEHLLSVHDTSPCHVCTCKQTGLTVYPSLSPREPWLHLVSFQLLGPDNTNHQNTLVHKPRLQPSGYALVNPSITLKASGPCCCPDTNIQPTQPKS